MMDPVFKNEIAKFTYQTIKQYVARNPKPDLIDLNERIIDAVELAYNMHTEESGIADVPESLQDVSDRSLPPVEEVVWDIQKLEPVRERPRVTPPPKAVGAVVPRDPSPLVLPGDPQFKETLDGKQVGKQPLKILRPTVAPRKKELEKPVWDEGDLINAILSSTPQEIEFDTHNREGQTVRLKVQRNVHNQAGMGSVLLTYKHAAINDQPADASTIILMAKVPFSVFQQEIDIETAMNGPTGIMQQLYGMYRARGEHMEPQSGPEPGPLRLEMGRGTMGDSYGESFQPGASTVQNPQNVIIDRQRKENDSLAPQGHRFNN